MPPSPPPHRILFVCLGNICRSPAAENIFRHMVNEAGREDEFFIDSAGTIDFHEGKPPDERMSDTLRRRGYKVSGRSRPILKEDLESFDLIVTMDEPNLHDVRDMDPAGQYHDKIKPLVSFLKQKDAPRVPDPYYGGQRGFEEVADLLEDGSHGILEQFS